MGNCKKRDLAKSAEKEARLWGIVKKGTWQNPLKRRLDYGEL